MKLRATARPLDGPESETVSWTILAQDEETALAVAMIEVPQGFALLNVEPDESADEDDEGPDDPS
jgi:hypothetical protein